MKSPVSIAVAFMLGATSVLAWDPFGWWPIALGSYAGLFWLVSNSKTVRQAGIMGLAFGFGLHLFGSGWVFGALHSKAGMGLIPAILSTAIFVVYLALFTAVPCLILRGLFRRALGRSGASAATGVWLAAAMTFASLLMLGEWARGLFFNGFTSLALGYSLIDTWLSGYAPVLGLYGLSWIGLCISGMLVVIISGTRKDKIVSLIVFAALVGTGIALNRISWTQPFDTPLHYRLIQSNIAQEHKFNPSYTRQQTQRLIDMIERRSADVIVTPETAFPMFLNELPDDALSSLQQFSQRTGSHVFLGIATIAANSDGYNSMIHIAPDQNGMARYNKIRLMPFGEYTPVGFGWFTASLSIPLKDMSAGAINQAPFVLGTQHIGTLICHEDLTGQEARHWVPHTSLLLNPSNLAWFEGSLAIDQRLQIVRMRALEAGRPILRVANTGITAAIDARGTVLARLPAAKEGILSGVIQPVQGLTPYARWGDWPVILMSVIWVFLAGYILRERKINKLVASRPTD